MSKFSIFDRELPLVVFYVCFRLLLLIKIEEFSFSQEVQNNSKIFRVFVQDIFYPLAFLEHLRSPILSLDISTLLMGLFEKWFHQRSMRQLISMTSFFLKCWNLLKKIWKKIANFMVNSNTFFNPMCGNLGDIVVFGLLFTLLSWNQNKSINPLGFVKWYTITMIKSILA